MVKEAAKKSHQILIHQINPKTYEKVVKLAKKEKRSVGKTAELMLEYYLDQHKL